MGWKEFNDWMDEPCMRIRCVEYDKDDFELSEETKQLKLQNQQLKELLLQIQDKHKQIGETPKWKQLN